MTVGGEGVVAEGRAPMSIVATPPDVERNSECLPIPTILALCPPPTPAPIAASSNESSRGPKPVPFDRVRSILLPPS